MIISLKHHEDGSWTWRRAKNSTGVYYTTDAGEGIFFQSDRTGDTKQLEGLSQFQACRTASGMRRKLAIHMEYITEDPRI